MMVRMDVIVESVIALRGMSVHEWLTTWLLLLLHVSKMFGRGVRAHRRRRHRVRSRR